MIPLPDVLRSVGGTRNKLNKWIAGGYLAHDIPKGWPGIPSEITRDAALEIAFMTVLTSAGFPPAKASETARDWLTHRGRGANLQFVCAINPRTSTYHPTAYRSDRPPLAEVLNRLSEAVEIPSGRPFLGPDKKLFRHPASVILINIGEVIQRIDALADYFEKK
jgi:hypothetical protein